MPKVYCDNGALCWVRVDTFKKEGVWMPKRTKAYLMEKNRSVDIDTEADFMMAKSLYKGLDVQVVFVWVKVNDFGD